MKRLLVVLVVTVFSAPVAAFADAKTDHNTKNDYNFHCAKCHRETKSLPKMAKQLEVDPRKLTLRTSRMNRDEMIAIVEKGQNRMPGFEKELTKEQIVDLVDYVIFLKKRTPVRSVAPTRLY